MNMLNSVMMLLSAVDDYTGIIIFKDILVVLMVLLAIAIIVIILMQKGTNDNIGVIGGDTYMGKNKGQNKEKKLKLATSIIGGIIVVLAIIYFVLGVI